MRPPKRRGTKGRRFEGRTLTPEQHAAIRAIRPAWREELPVGLVMIGVFVLWTAVLEDPVLAALALPGPLDSLAGFAPPLLLLAFALWYHRHAPSAVRARRRRLRAFGYALCGHCGYDLDGRDPNAGRCPECGRDLAEMPRVTAGA